MSIHSLSALLAAIVIAAIGLSVVLRDSRRRSFRAFAFLSFVVALWELSSFLGAAFITMVPIALNQIPAALGVPISTATASHLEFMIFGALIVFFLIVEPHGIARLWATAKEKLRLWPFPH